MYKYVVIFILLYISCVVSSGVMNYGKYDMTLKEISNCKGPKRKDCANSTFAITGKNTLTSTMIVANTVSGLKLKILGYEGNKEILKINVAKACDHIFFSALLKTLLKMTNDCKIIKGEYTFSMNLEDIMKNYHGGSFMFGDWTYKALFYNDDCNFTCGLFRMVVAPMKKL